jgi:hypothetical protein
MKRSIVLSIVGVLTLTSACTISGSGNGGPEQPVRPSASSGEALADGPLDLDGKGRACISLTRQRHFTYFEHVLEPDANVAITSVDLMDARHVETRRAFVSPQPGKVRYAGTTSGWPPVQLVTENKNVAWRGRMPAAGRPLMAGSRHNLWVHLRVANGVQRASFDALKVTYRAGDQRYVAAGNARFIFKPSCVGASLSR